MCQWASALKPSKPCQHLCLASVTTSNIGLLTYFKSPREEVSGVSGQRVNRRSVECCQAWEWKTATTCSNLDQASASSQVLSSMHGWWEDGG